jgi:hypothetical protein
MAFTVFHTYFDLEDHFQGEYLIRVILTRMKPIQGFTFNIAGTVTLYLAEFM